MKFSITLRAGFWALALALTVATFAVAADTGRYFSGSYAISNVNTQASGVWVTLHLEMVNHHGMDLYDVVLLVEDRRNSEQVLGTFPVSFIARGRSILLRENLLIPREEYAKWEMGSSLFLRVEFTDAESNSHMSTVELVIMPVPGEN